MFALGTFDVICRLNKRSLDYQAKKLILFSFFIFTVIFFLHLMEINELPGFCIIFQRFLSVIAVFCGVII